MAELEETLRQVEERLKEAERSLDLKVEHADDASTEGTPLVE
jgi:hypothetical protein